MVDFAKMDIDGKKLFIISEFVDCTQNSTGYYWSKIIRGLSEKFDEVFVITSESSFHEVEEKPDYATYILVPDVIYNKKKLTARLFGQVAQSILFAKAINQNVSHGDVVFSGTNPALLLILISILKIIKTFKWMILVHDVFPENLIAAKVISKTNLLYQPLKYMFDRAYSSADIIVTIGRDMFSLLSKKTQKKNRIEYIANWVDPNDIEARPKDNGDLTLNVGAADEVVFQFFGNIGRLQGIDNLLNAILLVKNKNALFVFVGSGSEERLISNFIENNPTVNIVHISSKPFSQNNAVLSSCDIAIVSLTEGMNGLGVPSKAYFSLAADKPLLVVTEKDSELCHLVSENKFLGWFCETGNPTNLASLIDDICKSDFSIHKVDCRKFVIEKYGHEQAIEKYSKLISQLGLNLSIMKKLEN